MFSRCFGGVFGVAFEELVLFLKILSTCYINAIKNEDILLTVIEHCVTN